MAAQPCTTVLNPPSNYKHSGNYRCLHSLAPRYLTDLCRPLSEVEGLCSKWLALWPSL